KTCKRVHNVSKVKSIWEHLFKCHINLQPKPFAILDQPFSMYTSLELEQQFLHWKRGEIAWQNHSLPIQPSPPQQLLVDILEPSSTYLLHGCWFLSCETWGGDIAYFDLDPLGNVSPKGCILIPKPPEGCYKTVMCVEEDWVSPLLAFTITMVYAHQNDFHEFKTGVSRKSRIEIWRSGLVLDNLNQGIDLWVERIAQAPLLARLSQPMRCISQMGSLVAFDVSFWDDGSDVVIFDWKDINSHSQCLRKTICYED
ncbi:hypothetical protein AN958_08425, partial [Leucoagaricus sp. SymC.cos]